MKIVGRLPIRMIGAVSIIAVSICTGLLLLEVVTRLLFPNFDPTDRLELNYRVGNLWLGRPGTTLRQIKNTGDYDVIVNINKHGLRDTKDISKATSKDLVVMGDSFAWGWGVESNERFSDRLQEITGRQTFNLATPTDIEGYTELLDYGKSLGADIGQLVLTICMENDIRFYDKPSYKTQPQKKSILVNLKRWLTSKSALYVIVSTTVHQTPQLKGLAAHFGFLIANLEGGSKIRFDADAIESSARKLEALVKHHRILVVLIPSRYLWVGPNREIEDRVHRAFAASLQNRDINVLDLRPAFEKGGAPLSYHFFNDGHWTARGHALASEEIARCLDKRVIGTDLDCCQRC